MVTINDLVLILLFILIAHTAIIKVSTNESKHSKAEIDLKYFLLKSKIYFKSPLNWVPKLNLTPRTLNNALSTSKIPIKHNGITTINALIHLLLKNNAKTNGE